MGRRNRMAATQVAFNPAQVRGLKLWLDGADTATLFQDTAATTPASAETNPVGYWRDKSGFGRHATQGTAGSRPVVATHAASNKTVLSFDGSNDFLSAGTTDSWSFLHNGTQHNIFVVYSVTSASFCGVLATGTTGTSTGFDILTHTTFMRHGIMNASAGPNVADNSVTLSASNSGMRVLRVRGFAASTPAADRSTMFADGTTQYKNNTLTGTAATSASTHPLIIGARGGVNIPLAGTIAEVLVFNSMATEPDMQQVEQYLRRKWSVANINAVSSPLDIPNCAIWLDGADTSTMYTTDSGPVTPVTAPTGIANCAAWYDASDSSTLFAANTGSTLATTTVGRWANKSGSAENRDLLQSDSTARPTIVANVFNGRPAVVFDGVNDFMQRSFTLGFPTTVFVVFSYNSPYSATTTLIDGAGTGNTLRIAPFSNTELLFNTGAMTPQMTLNANTIAINQLQMVSAVANGTSSGGWRNALDAVGSAYTTGTTTAPSGLTLCSWGAFGLQYANASIAEVIVYSAALSAADRVRVERYLSLKWGVPGVHATVAQTGDSVRYWQDKSGGGRHFTSPSSAPKFQASAINGRPAVEFSNSNMRCTGRSDAITQETVFLVATVASTVNNSRLFTQTTASGSDFAVTGHWIPLLRNTAATSLSSYADGGNRAVVSFANGSPTIMASTHTGSAITNFSNGVASASYSHTLSQTIGRYGIFEDITAGVAYTSGRVMEAVVYHRALSDSERARVTRYLQNKWGVGIVPPAASHPDASRWVQQVYVNGGTCSQATVDAVSSFCREIDAAGLRSKFYRLNLFCGNDLIACRTPLYCGPNANERHGFDLDVLTVGVGGSSLFTNTDYVEYGINGGLAGRLQTTTNANAGPGLRTGLVPYFIPAFYGPPKATGGPSFNYSSIHLAVYCRSLRTQTLGFGYLMGAYGGIGPAFEARHGMSFYVNQNAWGVGPFAANTSGQYDNVNRGLYLANVQSTSETVASEYVNELTLYAGAMRYNTSRYALGPFLHPNTDFGVFGECRASVAYSQNDNSLSRAEQTLQGYSIGVGLTQSEVQAYNAIMNRFQNRLGRGLPENTMPAFASITNADTRNWLSRVYTAGGTVSATTAAAVQTFCNAIEAAGIRDRFHRLNLFCGNNFQACMVPLYRGPTSGGTQFGGDIETVLNFTPEHYAETGVSGGLTGDGLSRSLFTGVTADIFNVDNSHLSVYGTNLSASPNYSFATAIGCRGATGIFELQTRNGNAASNLFSSIATAWAPVTGSSPIAAGHVLGTATAQNDARVFANGVQTALSTATNRGSGTLPANQIAVFGYGYNNNSVLERTSATIRGYSFGRGMTPTQAQAFYNAMQAFQTALSRNV